MPSKSASQRRLFQAAEHGATFSKAVSIRQHMSQSQMHDFASTTNAQMKKAKHPHANLGAYLHKPKRGR